VGLLLTLDRGNSTLDGMWHTDPPIRERVDPGDTEAVGRLLAAHEAASVVALTVVESGLTAVEEMLAARGCRMRLAGRDLENPLRVAYEDPSGLGVDRWVGAFAAHRLHGAAIVVDCGTAVTFSAVDGDGVFLGGAIAPGAATMAGGLSRAAPALPAVDLRSELTIPATSPQTAVDAGVQLGFCGMVDRLVDEVAAASGLVDSTVVLTGGTADVYVRHGRRAASHRPDLLHLGLRWLSETHDSNC
jgi:type III pantothenate kinase